MNRREQISPLVSIIIPTFNRENLIKETLQSIVSQTYTNWECIIVDDGSTDNTVLIVKEFIKDDARFLFYSLEHKGVSFARNHALSKISGEFIQFLDSDDILHEDKLKESLETLAGKEVKSKIVISNFMMFRGDLKNIEAPFCKLSPTLFTFEKVLYDWDFEFNIPIHCGFFHKSNFENFRFQSELGAKEDWIMWLKIFKNKPQVHFLDLPLAYYRYHEKNMTKDFAHMKSNFFYSFPILKSILLEEDFEKFLIFLIEKYYQQSREKTLEVKKYKNSGSYKLGYKIKKILLNLHLLSFGNWMLKKVKK
ncbi:glycosyltransferase family 2 protein [Flavobacterium sp. ACN6]|uniref:glycosyltransferase family 2 protein n=1 Tax=Flavobacterium sp. ACN6 TaxID=1920426 RepID=UPI000BB31E4E|nr:glycosyltransferase family 2 protein [Flavobacterium sp. ACN6]PBJ13850.1 UDP-Glc:alpha-D-GlcNAc-diphosphoundecaprenol beta-1,3-glucosyltransferase WfgD [Flavobacterium sp. ACN6]